MRAKILLGALLLVAIVAVAWFLLGTPSAPPQIRAGNQAPTPIPAAIDRVTPRSPPSQQRENPASDPGNPSVQIVADRPRSMEGISATQRKAAEADPQLLAVANSLREYRAVFRQNPVGNNAEITAILLGKNARNARYLPTDAQLNEKKELTDRWQQPVFFHQISGTIMEIRSAGPDHLMWNSDDAVLR